MAHNQKILEIAPPPDATYMLNHDSDLTDGPRHQAKFNHTLKDLQHLVYMALQAYQTHHQLTYRDDFNVYFPGACVLRENQIIINLTTGRRYTIDKHKQHRTGILAKLKEGTPADSDRLWFVDEEDFVRFVHADTRTEASSVGYDNSKDVEKEVEPLIPTVAWAVFREEPASKGRPFGDDDVAFKPKRVDEFPHQYVEGYRVLVDMQEFDNLILFDIYASNESEATRVKEWFKRAMTAYSWWFTYMGFVQFYFWRSNWELPSTRWRNHLAHRPILYYLRTQEISSTVVRQIGDIVASIRLATPEEHVGEQISINDLTGTVVYMPEITDKQFLERLSLED